MRKKDYLKRLEIFDDDDDIVVSVVFEPPSGFRRYLNDICDFVALMPNERVANKYNYKME